MARARGWVKELHASKGIVYQLKVSLRDVRPPVWRRLLILDSTDLHQLHLIIQDAMGWTNSHCYEFTVGGARFQSTASRDLGFTPSEKAASATLGQLAPSFGRRFVYWYDFGDDWFHDIVVEKALNAEAGAIYPRCIGGKRACPPENCGGPYGYANFLEAISDPKHPEHAEFLEWVGGCFDPRAFDLGEAGAALVAKYGQRWKRPRK
jgi:hypothetical protein